MKFPFQKRPKKADPLKDLLKNLPPGGRTFYLFEGEQVSPSYVPHPGDVAFVLNREWRPEGEPIPEPLETIPGYQRPVNWRQLQAAEDKQPGRCEVSCEVSR